MAKTLDPESRLNRLPVATEEQLRVSIDAMRMAESGAAEIGWVTDHNGRTLIVDKLAPRGKNVLMSWAKGQGSPAEFDRELDTLRRRRVVLAIIGSLPL